MIRLLIYFAAIFALAAIITTLLTIEGSIVGSLNGYAINWSTGPTLILFIILLLVFITIVWLTNYLMRLPQKLKMKRAEAQRARGMIALTRGLEAVAAGDPVDAQRHAKSAQRQLEEANLTRLLSAQAAHLAGDSATATENFSAMLNSPETEFLGLRGLYLQALAEGDQKIARRYADRAFKLRPNAQWAFESSYNLSIERGAWGEAHQALKLAEKSGMAKLENVERKQAVLLTAKAYAAFNGGDKSTAAKELKAALKRAPSFAPAATLAARKET